jgi:dTMP kinase
VTGRLIVFEGGEGSGKSTQAALLAARLGAVLTHEPGGTSVGAHIRGVVLGPGAGPSIDMRAEALLMAADRAQHVSEVIRPALARGADVVCDRFTGSTLAYHGYARGLDLDDLSWLSDWATGGLRADVVFLLDVPEDVATARMSPDHDRIEAAGTDFHRRVADGYRALAAADPHRWRVIDGSGSVGEVEALVLHAFGAFGAFGAVGA